VPGVSYDGFERARVENGFWKTVSMFDVGTHSLHSNEEVEMAVREYL
jgi:hypothetical protein